MSNVSSGNVVTGTIALDVVVRGNVNVGQAKLPSLTNPGSASDLAFGKQLIDANGNVVEGTMPDIETALDEIIAIQTELMGGVSE